MFKTYCFIVNPVAGQGKKLRVISEIQAFCRANHIRYELKLTSRPKEATALAHQAAGRFEVVVAVGGDGTVNEVGNGLIGTPAVLGILPTGSGNDLSWQLGYSRNFQKDMKILQHGTVRKIDVGHIDHYGHFFNGFGVGFDGEAASRVRQFNRYLPGFGAYLLAVLRTLVTYSFYPVRLTLDNGYLIEKQVLLVATCNGTNYGGGFMVAPTAKLDDGLFTICQVDRVNRFYALRQLPKFMRGTHTKLPEVHTFTSKSITIESSHQMVSQADGEQLPFATSFTVSMKPGLLPVIIG